MKKQNYELGGLDAIPDGALLNAPQISKVLGISISAARNLIISEGFKTIRISGKANSSVYIKAGDLKIFLDNGGAEPTDTPAPNVENIVDTIAAVTEPTADAGDELFELANELAKHSVIINGDPPAENQQAKKNENPTDTPPAEPTPQQIIAQAQADFVNFAKRKGVKGYGSK